MSQNAKLFASIRTNPKDVRFADACRAAEAIGFKFKRSKGSHNVFARPGEITALNFQNRDGKIGAYQARQLIEMLDKYEPNTEGDT